MLADPPGSQQSGHREAMRGRAVPRMASPGDLMPTTDGPHAYHLMAKPTGAVCNLDCKYCFYLDKEELYPQSRFQMSDEVMDAYIRQLIDSHKSSVVSLSWQGGEPTLMGLDFFRRV